MVGEPQRAPGTCSAPPQPATLNQVLHAEISSLRPGFFGNFTPSTFTATAPERASNLREIYGRINTLSSSDPQAPASSTCLSAICLSGGGIRSATFNLGVLQCLAKAGLLGKFDYLSSVSGGGYIAGWLRTWMRREGVASVIERLGRTAGPDRPLAPSDPLVPEPEPVSNLREYSNYLTPRVGLFSGDTWAAAATVVRNLILNWLVLIPLLASVIGLPLLFLLMVRSTGFPTQWCGPMLKTALGFELIASLLVYGFRRFAKSPGIPQAFFIFGCVLPIWLAAATLSLVALNLNLACPDDSPGCSADLSGVWGFAVLWCIVVPIVGWSIAEICARSFPERTRTTVNTAATGAVQQQSESAGQRQVAWGYEFMALLVSGAIGAALLTGVVHWWFAYLYRDPALYVMLGVPLLLGVYLFARVLFVVFASLGEATQNRSRPGPSDDADREWWARLSGWVLLVVLAWIALNGICLLGTYLPEAIGALLNAKEGASAQFVGAVKWLVGALGGVSGIAAALTGSSQKVPAGATSQKSPAPAWTKWLLGIAVPLFVVCLIVELSWGTKALQQWVAGSELFSVSKDLHREATPVGSLVVAKFLAVLVGLALLATGAGRLVNVNRFSLHGMYRNRLVRAYLGASNSLDIVGRERKPDPFTGFALDDNLQLYDLWRPANNPPDAAASSDANASSEAHLLPIINTTLNLVHGENLAWQQRKAASFSMTPLYCGNLREGYRCSREYGGPEGISVGTAITTSGAAANPNMGYSSSPALGFLMAIFNVRLGAWLGNTNENGTQTYRRTGPHQAIMPLFAEMFGLTNANRRYVNLSDGGHFDNLGLYEVVLRRCRHVLVSDAGQDGSFAFEDLGNAIRKIRIDFGVEIDFTHKIQILPNEPQKEGLYCAVATIRYSAADGSPADQDGVLIYIKPTLQGKGAPVPYDVYSYARHNDAFPHEPTADQWFSESQFESYRTLGFHILDQLSGGLTDAGFHDFRASVHRYIEAETRSSAARQSPVARSAPSPALEGAADADSG